MTRDRDPAEWDERDVWHRTGLIGYGRRADDHETGSEEAARRFEAERNAGLARDDKPTRRELASDEYDAARDRG